MLIGEITGKTGTKRFRFKAYKDIQNLDFVTVKGDKDQWILCQVDSVESYPDRADGKEKGREAVRNIASARIIGFRAGGYLVPLRRPVRPNSMVYEADKRVIQETLGLASDGLCMGRLFSNRDVPVYLDPRSLISKHLAVLASTGAGKSYAVGVILEELLDKKIPVVVIDPHGEYTSLKFANDNAAEVALMDSFGVKPKAYNAVEYSPDPRVNPGAEPLHFSDLNLTALELGQMMPSKLSPSQMALLYTVLRSLRERGDYSLDQVMAAVEASDSNAKWNVLNMLEVVKDVGLFSPKQTGAEGLVKPGRATIINLRGTAPEIQGVIVYKLVKDLFELRKAGRIPPIFLVVEESHNFCPEREVTASSKILRTVASEGRKFGLGLCVISQRPARIDKNIISQCNTQIVLRMTNPNDLKAVSYAEGMSSGLESEIKRLTTGTALILGMEQPVFVSIRPRRSRHGGGTVSVTEQPLRGATILAFKSLSKKSLEKEHGPLKKVYVPCYLIQADKQYLFEAGTGSMLSKEGRAVVKVAVDDIAAGRARPSPFPHKVQGVEIDGDVLRPGMTERQVLEAASSVLPAIKSSSFVHYPYFLGRDFMVDGLTGLKKEMKR